jgi:predicted O-methyltransferase YrrM
MHPLIEEIYRSRQVQDASGKVHALAANVDRLEGAFLHDLIAGDPTIRRTLEVGCAYGLSSLHICAALQGREGAHHTILDPFQDEYFHGIGVANLRRAGFDFWELIPRRSEFALPALAEAEPGSYDFVFIDGWHTFDHTLLDLFYANRLLRVGGYVVIDDCSWASVAKAVAYVANYPAYEVVDLAPGDATRGLRTRLRKAVRTLLPPGAAQTLLPKRLYDHRYSRLLFPRMVALRKIAEDTRDWKWFEPF